MKRTLLTIATSGLVLAATACGASPAATESAAPTGSPLQDYLGTNATGGGFAVSSQARGTGEQEQQVQDLVVTCMAAAGFEYLPYVPQQPEVRRIDGDLEWARTYGYGISTIDELAMTAESDDPNQAITDRMSDAEKASYFQALFGSGTAAMSGTIAAGGGAVPAAPPVMAGPGAPETSGGATPSSGAPTDGVDATPGCFPQASEQVYGTAPTVDLEEFSPLFEALGELQASIDEDPRLVPLVAAWSDCLADAGHPGFDSIAGPRDSVFEDWAELNGWHYTPAGGGDVVSVEVQDEQKTVDPVKLAELRATEIAVAVADLGCRGDYAATAQQVRDELETQFVADHLDELERYRDMATGGH